MRERERKALKNKTQALDNKNGQAVITSTMVVGSSLFRGSVKNILYSSVKGYLEDFFIGKILKS